MYMCVVYQLHVHVHVCVYALHVFSVWCGCVYMYIYVYTCTCMFMMLPDILCSESQDSHDILFCFAFLVMVDTPIVPTQAQ